MSRYDTLKPPDKGEFFKFPDGESKIRIVSEPYELIRHFIESEQKSYTCPGADKGCRFCAEGHEPKTKFIYRIIDRADGHLKLVEVGWSLVGAIKDLHDSAEYGFDTEPPYDMSVTKTGKGLGTKYALLAARANTPLTSDELAEIQAAKPIEDFIASKQEDAQYVQPADAGEAQRARERAEMDRATAAKPAGVSSAASSVDTFNAYKKRIEAATTPQQVDEIDLEAQFDSNMIPAAQRLVSAAAKARTDVLLKGAGM